MKKLMTIGILMGMTILGGTEVMASGSAYTTYMIEQMKIEKAERTPRKNVPQKPTKTPALINHR